MVLTGMTVCRSAQARKRFHITMSGTDVNLSFARPNFSRIATAEYAQKALDTDHSITFTGPETSIVTSSSSAVTSFSVSTVDNTTPRLIGDASRYDTMKVSLLPQLENCSIASPRTKPGMTDPEALSHLKNVQREAGGDLWRLTPRVALVFQKVLKTYLIHEILRLYRDRTFWVADWDTSDYSANDLRDRIATICVQYDLANPDEIDEEIKRLAMAILVNVSGRPDGELVEAVAKGAFGKIG
jgi:hypothetical protein